MNKQDINVKPGDEIVIVLPESAVEGDEIEIDFDELGIDLEALGEDVNIVIQIEGEDVAEDDFLDDDEDEMLEPNEWYFDDDPYGIVYYEFPDLD